MRPRRPGGARSSRRHSSSATNRIMLPLIDLTAISDSPYRADRTRARTATALDTYLRNSRPPNKVPAADRVVVEAIPRPEEGAALPAATEDDADRHLPRRLLRHDRSRVPPREPAARATARRRQPFRRRRRLGRRAGSAVGLTSPLRRLAIGARSRCSWHAAACRRLARRARDHRGRRRFDLGRSDRRLGVTILALLDQSRLAPASRRACPGHPLHPDPAVRAPGNLPFQLEPYRSRARDRRRLGALRFWSIRAHGSVVPVSRARLLDRLSRPSRRSWRTPDRVAQHVGDVNEELMFFLSFLLVLYFIASVIRRPEDVDCIARRSSAGGAVSGLSRSSRSGRVQRLQPPERVIPVLHPPPRTHRRCSRSTAPAKLRVFGSAQHPIALSARSSSTDPPLALYLAMRYASAAGGCAATAARGRLRRDGLAHGDPDVRRRRSSSSSGCGRGRSTALAAVIPALS